MEMENAKQFSSLRRERDNVIKVGLLIRIYTLRNIFSKIP